MENYMKNLKGVCFVLILVLGYTISSAQTIDKKETTEKKNEIAKLERSESSKEEKATEKKDLQGIKYRLLQDNGFLVEEAFTQESDEIQHTLKFRRNFKGNAWESLAEEELPLGNEKHQLTIAVPVSYFTSDNNERVRGIGDVEIGYRYQLLGGDTARVSIAPGISTILPTGKYQRELGTGSFGVELSLPISIALSKRFMTHSNVGITFLPRARNPQRNRANITNFELGQSLVWLVHPKFNPLVEVVWERNKEVIGHNFTKPENELFVSPGFRWGHTFKNGLTIFPGVAFPIGVAASKGDNGIFFYLSFEHPFKKRE